MASFPENPQDGEIFQDPTGSRYVYSAKQNCWQLIPGEIIPLADALNAGLMSSSDLKKLMN